MSTKNKKDDPHFQSEVQRLHEMGWSRSRIAKELGSSAATVGLCAKQMGLEWDRSRTAAAVHAKTIDNKVRRLESIDRLYRIAHAQMDRLEAETYTHRVTTGRESIVVTDQFPNADEVRNHVQAVYSAFAIAQKLEAIDATPGTDAAVSTLKSIGKALGLTSSSD